MTARAKSGAAGIREIADALGVSIGTVDRALHGRSGVSEGTRERVLAMARQLNYSPNLAARHLKLNRRQRVGVFLPKEIASFYDPVRYGIQAAAKAIAGSVEVAFHEFPRIGEGDLEALQAADWTTYDGVILAPGQTLATKALWQQIGARQRPVVLVTTDAPDSERLASVAVDGVISGSIAAELLSRAVRHEGAAVAVFTGDLRVHDHADKVRGFLDGLGLFGPHLCPLAPVETHDHAKLAYDEARALMREVPGLCGVYCSTANSLPVLQAAREAGLLERMQIITTDLFPELCAELEAGAVLATLEQRPFTQGRRAFELLSSFLSTAEQPERLHRLAPHIVLRSNLPLFLQRLGGA